METVATARSVAALELQRHVRLRRTLAVFVGVMVVCTIYSSNLLRVTDIARGRTTGTHGTYYLRSIGHDILFPVLASASFLQLVLVCFATLLGASAIVGGREDGTLRTLQSFPVDRRPVYFGCVLARVVVLAAVVVSVFGLTVLLAFQSGLEPSLSTGVAFIVVLLLYLIGFVSIGAFLSTLHRRRGVVYTVALVTAFGLTLAATLLPYTAPQATLIAPGGAFETLVASLDGRVYTTMQVEHGGGSTAVNFTVGEIPWFASTGTALLSQILWVVLPAAAGLYRYERCDLTA